MARLTDLSLEILQIIRDFLIDLNNSCQGFYYIKWKESCLSWRNFLYSCFSKNEFSELKKDLMFYDLNGPFSAEYIRYRQQSSQTTTNTLLAAPRIFQKVKFERNQISLTCDNYRRSFLPPELPPVYSVIIHQQMIYTLQPYHLVRHIILLRGNGIQQIGGRLTNTESLHISSLFQFDTMNFCHDDFVSLKSLYFGNRTRNRNSLDLFSFIHLFQLNLSFCDNINDVSMLGNLHYLNLSHCKLIVDVSSLGKVYHLILDGCEKVIDLQHLNRVSILSIKGLTKLQHLLPLDHTVIHLRISSDMVELFNPIYPTIRRLMIGNSSLNDIYSKGVDPRIVTNAQVIKEVTLERNIIIPLAIFPHLSTLRINDFPETNFTISCNLSFLHILVINGSERLRQVDLSHPLRSPNLRKVYLSLLADCAIVKLYHQLQYLEVRKCPKFTTLYCFQEPPAKLICDKLSSFYTICRVDTTASLLPMQNKEA